MNERSHRRGISRRTLLKTAAAAASSLVLPTASPAREEPAWRDALLTYLETLARPDGGYGWEDAPQSHLTPTFAVVGCYRLLKRTPPNPGNLGEFVRTHHPSRLKRLEQPHRHFEYQQVQALLWLGEGVSSFHTVVGDWKPYTYLTAYERHGYPVFGSEAAALVCRRLLGLPADEVSPEFVAYLRGRRRGDGSFNNTPAEDGSPGHVLNTWWGLQAWEALNLPAEQREGTIGWLRACQLPCGGFTYQPDPPMAGWDDVAYTRAAVGSLKLLETVPKDTEACIGYLFSLRSADGGFGDRPGWMSNPLATYYALDALAALGALDREPEKPPRVTVKPELPEGLNVFSIQIEAHGQGSPAEAVELARALRIHLWGAKNASPEWLARAQQVADQANVPVRFFCSNEEYGTWVDVPGQGTYSHTSDVIAPAGIDFGRSLAGSSAVSWEHFRRERLVPLRQAGGGLVWQFGENEPLVRLYLDDSLQRGGYAAISTFHFSNPDFTNSEPFLGRWRGQIPFVALQDAHGAEPWWFADMTTGFRTLFLATEPTWEGWLGALRENRVVAVRRDATTDGETWFHAGSPQVLDFVRRHDDQWRWWDNPEIGRPPVSIVALRPEDQFEAARPERGIAIRVRCARENTTQGLVQKPIAELVELTVDGEVVQPVLVAPRAPWVEVFLDHYHRYDLPAPAPGRHTVQARARVVVTGEELTRRIEFLV